MTSNYHFKFEDLKVYQKAMDFGELVDGLVRKFPNHELYALSSQYRRAADLIALNITEGYPGSDAQFVKHLNHSIYSANECVSCSTKAKRRLYINFEEDEENRRLLSELTNMLSSLRNKILERNQQTNP
ncbi:four helix bundle protein [Flavivirga sp. 57AJ16]|uniref:four helix bundle protein n=1 Tax=Flavivirga sp. 57AJ16 TaxID=3025307 RepID=UPI0023670987|nr:four helix bundle protein [Flavivirga sp. 57AJ16]MDD7887604.1 four helix bundle protein [Flavivirga sp. 57AJ16]